LAENEGMLAMENIQKRLKKLEDVQFPKKLQKHFQVTQ
jgi:hypothetical protein